MYYISRHRRVGWQRDVYYQWSRLDQVGRFSITKKSQIPRVLTDQIRYSSMYNTTDCVSQPTSIFDSKWKRGTINTENFRDTFYRAITVFTTAIHLRNLSFSKYSSLSTRKVYLIQVSLLVLSTWSPLFLHRSGTAFANSSLPF